MKHSNPIDPLKLPEQMPDRNKHLGIEGICLCTQLTASPEFIPVNALEELKKIVKRFAVHAYVNHLKDYKDKRGKFLVNSVRKLNPEKFIKDNAEGYVTRFRSSPVINVYVQQSRLH